MASADGATPGMGVLFNDSSDESDSDLEASNKEKRKDDDDAEDADDANDDGADQNKSDDDEPTTNETAPTANKETESNEGDKDDGSGGDDDDNGKGEKEASPDDGEKGQDGGSGEGGGGGGRRIGDADDEEDEDDSDAEFDDKDANIVGKSAPPKPPPRPKSQHDDDDGYDDVNRRQDSTSSPSSRPARPPRKPRNMEVLDVSRPSTHRRGVTLHITKLPNVVGINPEAFDRNTYDADVEEREYSGFVHNMIRWRYKRDEESGDFLRDKNGKLTRESNARFVKWSDGSTTLHVGNETFEVDEVDASNTSKNSSANSGEKKFPGLNGYLYLSQKAMFRSNEDGEDGEGGEPEPGGTVLECMGSVSSKLVPRPSIKSEAHKNLTLAVRQKNMKRARIAEYVTQVDPEKEKSERIKNKDDLNRQEARGGGRKTPSRKYRPSPGMNRRYLEMDEDDRHYDSVNIGSLKRRNEMDDVMDYGEDSDSGEDDWSRRKKAGFQRGSRRPPQKEEDEEDNEEEAMFGEDSSDEENLKQARKKKRSHQAVVDEDDD